MKHDTLRDLQNSPPPANPARLGAEELTELLKLLPGWAIERQMLVRKFSFKDFHETMGFVNAVAWIANRMDHHPDLVVGYNRCEVAFTTHSAGGLTRSDAIAAARVCALVGEG